MASIQTCDEYHLPGILSGRFSLLEIPDAVAGSVVVAHRKLLYFEKIVATLLIATPHISGQLKEQAESIEACRDESEPNI